MKNLFKKASLLSVIMLFSAQAEFKTQKDSFKKEVLFDKVFNINSKVQKRIQSFFAEFLKKELSDIKIRFSRYTDLSYGFAEGIFSAEINPELSHYPSLFDGTFLVYVDPNEGKPIEYGFHFETELSITQSSSFFDFIQNETPLCKGEGVGGSFLLSFCNIFKIQHLSSETKKLPVIKQNLLNWKSQLVEQLSSIEDPDFLPIQEQFVNWVENRIVIKESENQESVTVSIDLSGMKEEFEEDGKKFLVNTELTDYSLETFQLEFFEDEVLIYLHIRKLQIVSQKVKDYMEYTNRLVQNLIENEGIVIELAQELRQALRDRRSLTVFNIAGIVVKHTPITDLAGGAVEGVKKGVIDFLDRDEEEELGLD